MHLEQMMLVFYFVGADIWNLYILAINFFFQYENSNLR